MASIRRYGPTRGAGTTLTEKQAEKAITQSPFGVTAWAGIFEKGETDKLISTISKSDFNRKCGSRIKGSYAPDSGEDFWDASKGAGQLNLVRITDGTGRKASLTLKTRESNTQGNGLWRNALKLDGKSVGRWAGINKRTMGEITGVGDLTETTIDTALTLLEDEFAGGTLVMPEITGKVYEIVGNTVAGVVTINSDYTLLTDFASGTDNTFILFKDNVDEWGNTKNLAALIKNGSRDPANEWGCEAYWNGVVVLNYENCSMDPNSDVYFVNVMNDDDSNEEWDATDLFTGTVTASTRPANQFGEVLTGTLTATQLEIEWYQAYNDPGNTGGDTSGTVGTISCTTPQKDFITLDCNDITTPGSELWTVTSTAQPDTTFDDATTAVAYTPPNDYFPAFTVEVGVAPWIVGDKLYIVMEPLVPDEVIGHKLFYDIVTSPYDYVVVTDNTETTVTVNPGNDLSTLTAEGNFYRLEFPEGLIGGYDGHAGVTDNEYIAAWDLGSSYFNQMKDKKLGLIKYGMPGVTSVTVQQAGRTYAETNNGPYRAEITSATTTEQGAVAQVESTLGRNDFMEVTFPSYYYKQDPDTVNLKLVSATGAIQGLEAFYAYTYQGYHKAAAGIDAILNKAVKMTTGEKVLDHEILNPSGIQMITLKEGNWVLWGDRIPASSTGTIWKHKREQLSHYERVLFENFDYIIFAINDEEERRPLLSVFKAYFLPEWRPKRAIAGPTFDEAAQIKIDNENNTPATQAAQEMNAELTVYIVDTVEKFNIIVNNAGVFEG
jgi:hypothetical protein